MTREEFEKLKEQLGYPTQPIHDSNRLLVAILDTLITIQEELAALDRQG